MAAAFSVSTMNHLNYSVRKLFQRRQLVGMLQLTHEEYTAAFVPQQARELFRQIAPWTNATWNYDRWEYISPAGEKHAALLNMHVCGGVALPLPRSLSLQKDAPKEITERIDSWFEHGGDVSRDFGRVSKVLELLNASFSRVAIRYYWPTILAICSENPQTEYLVKEMQELRTPAKLKPLPSGLAIACRQTAETIATTRLIPHDIETPENIGVDINMVPGQTYTELGIGTFYGLQ